MLDYESDPVVIRYRQMLAENDWEPILKTIVKEGGAKDIGSAEVVLDAWLQWAAVYPEVPEGEVHQMLESVDPAWHAFMLHTAKYREFCDKYFGHFLDHDPLDTEDISREKDKYGERTLELLKKHFGEILNRRWLHLRNVMTCCGPAGCKDKRI